MRSYLVLTDSGLEIGPLHSVANRHGLTTGATGTGKTVTVQAQCEAFSQAGIPVFVADVKGDLSGLAAPGGGIDAIDSALKKSYMEPIPYQPNPCEFWDFMGEQGLKLGATVESFGPELLSRIMDLSQAQKSILGVIFKIAFDQDRAIFTLDDLAEIIDEITASLDKNDVNYRKYEGEGYMSKQSLGAIRRAITDMKVKGLGTFFEGTKFDFFDLMKVREGRGVINILSVDRVINVNPEIYTTFLVWIMKKMFQFLPEVGNLDKPKLVFFFDEAHLLFKRAPTYFIDEVERVVRLIRSKGVGIYFITQKPTDIPRDILGQLGSRVQHALRAFTADDERDLRLVAKTFSKNPAIDIAATIPNLGTGEVLISFLDYDSRGELVPCPVQRGKVVPPLSRIGPITQEERDRIIEESPFLFKYNNYVSSSFPDIIECFEKICLAIIGFFHKIFSHLTK